MKLKQLREKYRSKYPASLVAAAVKIAIDMGGNMTGAYKKIEAMKRGLADDPIVADALKQANESVNEELGEVRPFKKGWSPAEWRIVRKDKKIEKDIEKFYKSMGGKYGDPRKAMTVKQAEKNIPYLYKHVVSNFGVVNNTSLANAIMKFYDHWDDGKGVYKYESVNEDYAQDLDLAQKNMARLAKKEKGQDKKDYEAVARALNQGNLGAVKKVIKSISTDEIRADILNVLVGYNDLIAKMYPKAVDNKGNLKRGLTVGKMIKDDFNEAVSPEEKAQLALKHAKELETIKKKHEREKENMKEEEAVSPAQQAAIAIAKKKAKKVVENYMAENYRTLAKHGMGAETKKSIKVGTEVDYYRADGAKYMGKVTKMTPTTYIVKDTKNGKNYQFTYHDRMKAKALLKK